MEVESLKDGGEVGVLKERESMGLGNDGRWGLSERLNGW